MVAPGDNDDDPGGHGEQEEAPTVAENLPTAQSAQLSASTLLENVPGPQGGHELFEPTKKPGEHVLRIARIF